MPPNLGIELLLYNFTRSKIPSKKFFINQLRKFLDKLKEKKKIELALLFISAAKMRALNKYWRKKDKATSVLSFPRHKQWKKFVFGGSKDLGEIIFCPTEIKKKSRREGISEKNVYRRLLAHSLLHLYGYTHDSAANQLKMERKEKTLLA